MKNKNSIIVNWNPVKKRPYPYINEEEENNLILKKLINKKLKINSIQYNIDEYLIKKTETMNLKDYVNNQIKELNESISINKIYITIVFIQLLIK